MLKVSSTNCVAPLNCRVHSARFQSLLAGGPQDMALVREFADWWNLDIRYLDNFDGDKFARLRSQVGSARVSIQEMVAYVARGSDRASVASAAMRRFHHSRPVIGTGAELAEHFAGVQTRELNGCIPGFAISVSPKRWRAPVRMSSGILTLPFAQEAKYEGCVAEEGGICRGPAIL